MVRLWVMAVALAGVLAGCRSAPDPVAFESAPADFALGVTVYAPGAAPRGMATPPRALRPARYVVEPDLSLRSALLAGLDHTDYPPLTRHLPRGDVDRLWRLVRDSGMLDEGNPERIDSPAMFGAQPGRRTALISVAYGGVGRYYRVVLDEPGPGAFRALRLIERLADLAWVPE